MGAQPHCSPVAMECEFGKGGVEAWRVAAAGVDGASRDLGLRWKAGDSGVRLGDLPSLL